MFKSQQHREKAAAYGEMVKHSNGQGESDKFQKLRDRHSALADSEQGLADNYDSAVNAAEQDRARGLALAAEEEHVLRCLGAAVIMQWNALPKTLQREIFDTAGSVGKLLETATLRGQIARFLHKHKNDAGANSRGEYASGCKIGCCGVVAVGRRGRCNPRRTAEVNQRRQQEDSPCHVKTCH